MGIRPIKQNVLFWLLGIGLGVSLTSCPTQPGKPDHNTPDTTSHQFTWTVDTLGGPGSYLSDVAVVSPEDIWVVGQVVLPDPDSSWNGSGWEHFNAAHWDGDQWDAVHVPAVTAWGSISRGPINAVFVTPDQTIWMFSDVGSYATWDGSSWTSAYVPEHHGMITQMWGTSSSNLFFVGGNGSITHYNGASFTDHASGTTLPLRNVWGTPDGSRVWVSITCLRSSLCWA